MTRDLVGYVPHIDRDSVVDRGAERQRFCCGLADCGHEQWLPQQVDSIVVELPSFRVMDSSWRIPSICQVVCPAFALPALLVLASPRRSCPLTGPLKPVQPW